MSSYACVMEQLFDLPAHPLLVHVPVVVVPVVTFALLWWVVIRKYPKGFPLLTLVLSLIAGVGLLLASSSGEALVEAFGYLREEPFVREHIKASESARLWGVVTTVLVVMGYFARRLVGRVPVLATVSKVVLVAALAASISASGFTIQAGHNGAKARWIDIQFESNR